MGGGFAHWMLERALDRNHRVLEIECEPPTSIPFREKQGFVMGSGRWSPPLVSIAPTPRPTSATSSVSCPLPRDHYVELATLLTRDPRTPRRRRSPAEAEIVSGRPRRC